MSNKHKRSGGKFSGNHTSLIPAAAVVSDIAHKCPEVTKISPGYIKGGLRSANGHYRVKITDHSDKALLLSIRGNTSHQEVSVYTDKIEITKLAIVRAAQANDMQISFGKNR